MEMQKVIEQAEQNIGQALKDYGRHTGQVGVLDDVSDRFICQLAKDSSWAKQELRKLFSRSPVWDERIDALVINGTRTHNPDYDRIRDLGNEIMEPLIGFGREIDSDKETQILSAIDFFASPDTDTGSKARGVSAINKLAPAAYAPTRRPSRVFRSLCAALGVADETAGSDFQRLYAQFADELSAKRISFKLYVSINPAHFLTMSNPKGDRRGMTLTSCHSFNSTEYRYNSGCIGYARDEVSLIVFTVDGPGSPESLNNRKTTRQVFAYRPGNGLLLQSRMYNTSGGTRGAQADSKLYRDLVQREVSMLEGAPNLWRMYPYGGGHEDTVDTDDGFGGYRDWEYPEFDGKVSIRAGHEGDWEALRVGAPGLCICCGAETGSEGWLYCGDGEKGICSECGHACGNCHDYVGETFPVYNGEGDMVYVCEGCRDRYFTRCGDCEDYYPNGQVRSVEGGYVCSGCLAEGYFCCEECGEYHHDGCRFSVTDGHGEGIEVCGSCRDRCYTQCAGCGGYFHDDTVHMAYGRNGHMIWVCGACLEQYQECPSCGEHVTVGLERGEACPLCGAAFGKEEVPA